MKSKGRTVAELGEAVQQALDAKYTLVYNSQGDVLPDDVVAALVKGENWWATKGGEAFMQWESECRWTGACDVVDELSKEVVGRWEQEDGAEYADLLDNMWSGSNERMSAIDIVYDRDESDLVNTLIQQHGAVLLRVTITAMDEDAGLSYTALTREQFLDLLGFEHTPNNMHLAGEVIDNALPEYGVAIGQALIGVDLTAIANLPGSGLVKLCNPHVWLGNPFAGSGWCSEDAFTGTLTVDRGDLRTDDGAFGYSWNTVVGGTSPSYFSGEIAPIAMTE
jgi:hypothetical protein